MIIRSKAPLRVSFAGGGTDVPPYCEEKGGAVLSVTIDKYAYGTLVPSGNIATKIESLDYDVVAKYHTDRDLVYNGELDLVKAVLRNMNKGGEGVNLFLHTDAPPGSGLGSSSAMMVALIGLFRHWQRRPMTDYEIAELAYHIERKDLKIQGGKQDQYAATFGGFNFIEFNGPTTVVNPLRIGRDVLNEFEYRLLLCYTGKTRLSAKILKTQIKGYVEKKKDVVKALDETKSIAIEMKNALLQGHIDKVGELLNRGWTHKKKFAKRITTPAIDRMYDAALKHGAIGGKLLGAGGGGYLMFLCEFDKKHILAKKLDDMGGQVIDFGFDLKGLQTWTVYS